MNGVFKVTDKDEQKFVIISTNGTQTTTQEFDLSGLTMEEAPIVEESVGENQG